MSMFPPIPDRHISGPSGTNPFDGNSTTGLSPATSRLVPAKLMRSSSDMTREWTFGFVTGIMLCCFTSLLFVLFCPIWQEWRHPEPVPPQVIVMPPKVFVQLIPLNSPIVNRGNEFPTNPAPPIMPGPEDAPLAPVPPPVPAPAPSPPNPS